MDVEELLDVFYVRKTPLAAESEETAKPTAPAVDNSKTYICIPLLLKHLKALQQTDAGYKTIFNGRVMFRLCLVYGRIVGVIRKNDRLTKYVLDDSTDCLDVCVFHECEKSQIVQELENELYAADEDAENGQSQVIKSLKQILLKIKEQVDHSNISLGTKVIVLGRPQIFRGEVSINASSISADNSHSRDNEIAFKYLLLQWYNENLFPAENKNS